MMAKMLAGAEARDSLATTPLRAPAYPTRLDKYVAGFAADAHEAAEIVARLRKGRALLASMDAVAVYRAEAEALWSALVMDLYIALRSAYARFALIRKVDEENALAMWSGLMPDADDMRDLGAPQLFDHYRGRMSPPEWITDSECRLVTQLLWPPRLGEDALDTGVFAMTEPPPF